MKILHFANLKKKLKSKSILRVGGPESSVLPLVRAQSKKHHVGIINTDLVYVKKNKNFQSFKVKFNLLNLFYKNPYLNILNTFGKPSYLIIHEIYNFNIFPIIILSKFFKIKVLISPRGTFSNIALKINKYKKLIFFKLFLNFFLNFIHGFIALNHGEKNQIKKLYKNKNIYIIPNGIEKKYSIKKKNLLRNYKKEIKIFYLGRFDFYIKGLDILLKEFEIYLRKSKKKIIKLVFIGEHRNRFGFSSKNLINDFNKLYPKNRILVKGPYYGKKKFIEIAKLDALIQPSRSEGMPNTVLEAMSVGLPVFATKYTNVTKILNKNRCGWEISHKKNNISNFLLNLEDNNKKKLYQYGLNGLRYSNKKLNIQKISNYCFLQSKIRSYKF